MYIGEGRATWNRRSLTTCTLVLEIIEQVNSVLEDVHIQGYATV